MWIEVPNKKFFGVKNVFKNIYRNILNKIICFFSNIIWVSIYKVKIIRKSIIINNNYTKSKKLLKGEYFFFIKVWRNWKII